MDRNWLGHSLNFKILVSLDQALPLTQKGSVICPERFSHEVVPNKCLTN